MGKTALFAITAFIVMGAFYGMGTTSGLLATEDEIASNDYQVLARNAALAGYNVAKQKLADEFKQHTAAVGQYHGGEYYAVFQVNTVAKTATVTSTGSAYRPDGTLQQYKIVAKFEQVDGATDEVPAEAPKFMEYALISEEDITLNGNVSIDTVKVVGQEGGALNANVHTNGHLKVNGSVKVRGFGTYKTTRTLNPNKPTRFFSPYENTANEPVVKQVPEGVEIPLAKLNPTTMNAMFTPDKTTGSVPLEGNYDFVAQGATREDPFIWYVDGSLTIKDGSSFKGYVIFIVRDDITMNGNVSITTGLGPTENTLALYACDDFTLSGNGSVQYGQIFVKDDFTLNGTPRINGNVIVGGTATLNGTPDINYYPPSPALTRHFQAAVERLKLVAYHEDVVS